MPRSSRSAARAGRPKAEPAGIAGRTCAGLPLSITPRGRTATPDPESDRNGCLFGHLGAPSRRGDNGAFAGSPDRGRGTSSRSRRQPPPDPGRHRPGQGRLATRRRADPAAGPARDHQAKPVAAALDRCLPQRRPSGVRRSDRPHCRWSVAPVFGRGLAARGSAFHIDGSPITRSGPGPRWRSSMSGAQLPVDQPVGTGGRQAHFDGCSRSGFSGPAHPDPSISAAVVSRCPGVAGRLRGRPTRRRCRRHCRAALFPAVVRYRGDVWPAGLGVSASPDGAAAAIRRAPAAGSPRRRGPHRSSTTAPNRSSRCHATHSAPEASKSHQSTAKGALISQRHNVDPPCHGSIVHPTRRSGRAL
jgi:hypothetical protein